MADRKPTFEVDKAGLAKILERRGKDFAVIELIQNAWDENTTRVDVTLEPNGHGLAWLVVEDDNPAGFADLSHAYTLFAESAKKTDVTKRGRFNLGEKLVIAICKEASIATTKGTITFDEKGRVHGTKRRTAGSVFSGLIRMTKDDIAKVERAIWTLIPPAGITTYFNGVEVARRKPVATFEATLRTERADEDGNLKPTTRKTTVEVYDPLDGEKASIYEMGLPVVTSGDRYHLNVGQKVPLNLDRDNVPPSYLRDLRALTLNATADLLTDEDTKATWVTNAIEDEKIEGAAITKVIVGRYGDKALRADPSDPESIKRAVAEGYQPIAGGAFSGAAWQQIREKGNLKPTSSVTPGHHIEVTESAEARDVPPDKWTDGMRNVKAYAEALAPRLIHTDANVRFINESHATYGATWSQSGRVMTFNVGRLGYAWFEHGANTKVTALILHEFAHHYEADHMSDHFIHICTELGARATMLALDDPDLFAQFRTVVPA